MLRKLIYRLFRYRHFWRDVGFDELSEIYVSMMFRSLSIGMTGIFIPLYMLKLDYSIADIMLLQISFFAARVLFFDLIAGIMISKYGPKHTMLWGYLLLIASTAQFLTLPTIHWPIWLIGGIWGGTSSLFAIPFHVDFSKIKDKIHGGKELGYVKIIQYFAGAIGPLAGGLVATIFGAQYIFLVAIIFLVMGGIPLLKTREPTKTNQKLKLKAVNLRKISTDIFSMAAYDIDLTASVFLWPFYLGVFVLATGASYAKLGSLASFSVVASMLAAFAIGKLIDNHKGRSLLRFGAIVNAGFHLFRPFVNTYPQALLINTLDNPATVAYQMAYTKGMYDVGDDMSNQRAAYFTIMEWSSSIAKLIFWIILAIMINFWTTYAVMTLGFVIASIASLLIMKEQFPALLPKED